MGKRETKINRKLTEVLKDHGLNAIWESEHSGNTSIDIEVILDDNIRVAVECEKHGSGKRASAVKDASSRLDPVPLVHVALAIVYSKECTSEEHFTDETRMEYAVIIQADTRRYKGDHKAHSNVVEWKTCRARDLPNIIRHLPKNLGEPDRLANDLKMRLAESANALSVLQCRNLTRSINLDYSRSNNQNRLEKTAARQALLIVASASLFHARLDDRIGDIKLTEPIDSWPPMSLQECHDAENTKTALSASWEVILKFDYIPIFKSAKNVLAASNDPVFVGAVKSMARWALDTIGQVGGLRHDLLGKIFHAVLDTARNDGSYYTTTPAAVLLAELAIRDRSDIPDNPANMMIVDPACGTGTLLMAAGERIREILPDISSDVLIEKILNGADINMTATHMAATTLGLLSPSTKFSQMNIGVARLGIFDGKARAGSLEMYVDDGMLPYQNWFDSPLRQIETDVPSNIKKHSADLVIMNPPFTRNDIRHDQLGRDVEKRVKEREEYIFSKASDQLDDQLGRDEEKGLEKGEGTVFLKDKDQHGKDTGKPKKQKGSISKTKDLRYSSDPMFMLLAERLQNESGVLAVVRPAVVAASPSSRRVRLFLAKKYHIDTIIMPHDPKRFRFSESTNIGEILIVMRRGEKKDTRIINLAVNPGTVAEAAALARQINTGENGSTYNEVRWPRFRVGGGDWSGVLFYSPYLTECFMDIRDEKLFKTTKLSDIATMTGPRNVRGVFTPTDRYDKHSKYARYDHKTGEVTAMRAAPNKYLTAKAGKERQAEVTWENGAHLHIAERVQPNITHVIAVKTDYKSVGTSWYAIKPKTGDAEKWSKAMVVYLNSTIGVVTLLGVRVPRKPLYPRFSGKDLLSLPLPVMSKETVAGLATIYDVEKDRPLGVWRNPNETKVKLDRAVCRVLGLNDDTVGRMRVELAREPMVTGRRYGEQPVLEDYTE